MTPEANIADISLQAFILHQNQRKIKIKPVPAPNIRIISNNCNAFVNTNASKALNSINTTVDILPTFTSFLSEAFLSIFCL